MEETNRNYEFSYYSSARRYPNHPMDERRTFIVESAADVPIIGRIYRIVDALHRLYYVQQLFHQIVQKKSETDPIQRISRIAFYTHSSRIHRFPSISSSLYYFCSVFGFEDSGEKEIKESIY